MSVYSAPIVGASKRRRARLHAGVRDVGAASGSFTTCRASAQAPGPSRGSNAARRPSGEDEATDVRRSSLTHGRACLRLEPALPQVRAPQIGAAPQRRDDLDVFHLPLSVWALVFDAYVRKVNVAVNDRKVAPCRPFRHVMGRSISITVGAAALAIEIAQEALIVALQFVVEGDSPDRRAADADRSPYECARCRPPRRWSLSRRTASSSRLVRTCCGERTRQRWQPAADIDPGDNEDRMNPPGRHSLA